MNKKKVLKTGVIIAVSLASLWLGYLVLKGYTNYVYARGIVDGCNGKGATHE